MIRAAGRRAFAALHDLLQLPGTTTLNDVDISVASPVVDLMGMVRRAGVTPWVFINAIDTTTAGFEAKTQAADPRESNHWEKIIRGGETVAVVPRNTEDILITAVGVHVGDATDFNDFSYYREVSGTVNTDPDIRQLMFFVDTPTDEGSYLAGTPGIMNPLPWLDLAADQNPWSWEARYTANGISQANLILTAYSGPPGSFEDL